MSRLEQWSSGSIKTLTHWTKNKINREENTETHQKTSLQWEHWNGKKSSRLHDAKLQCFPIESRSASSAMMELWFQRTYSSFWSAVYIHSAESWCESGKITSPDSSKETKVVQKFLTTLLPLTSCSQSPWRHEKPRSQGLLSCKKNS